MKAEITQSKKYSWCLPGVTAEAERKKKVASLRVIGIKTWQKIRLGVREWDN